MQDPQAPKGTAAVMAVYFVVIVALWSFSYLTMLSRGITS